MDPFLIFPNLVKALLFTTASSKPHQNLKMEFKVIKLCFHFYSYFELFPLHCTDSIIPFHKYSFSWKALHLLTNLLTKTTTFFHAHKLFKSVFPTKQWASLGRDNLLLISLSFTYIITSHWLSSNWPINNSHSYLNTDFHKLPCYT